MTLHDEESLRQAFATLVPEAPTAVTDARPVVLKARQRRRRVAATVGAAALVGAAVAVPAVLNSTGGQGSGEVASEPPQAPDPFTTLPCTDLPAEVSAGFDPATVTAARLCVVEGLDLGFPYPEPPADALVTALDDWRTYLGAGVATRLVAEADPARCAAVDVMPSPLRLLVEQDDGSRVLVDPNVCGNVTLAGVTLANKDGSVATEGDVTVDGDDVARTFLAALAAQRADLPAPEPVTSEVDCAVTGTLAVPTSSLATALEARQCPVGKGPERGMDQSRLAMLADAFAAATRGGEPCDIETVVDWNLVTVDAYGDTIRWAPDSCGDLVTISGGRTPEQTWRAPLDFAD